MGLPKISIEFITRAVTAVKRSQLGIVALILKDDTQTADTVEYKGIDELKKEEWSTENYDYITSVLKGTPSKVIVERLDTVALDYNDAFTRLNNKRFNYLAAPGHSAEDGELIATWIKGKRENDKKTFKAVLANIKGDSEGIINLTTEDIAVGDKVYSAAEFTGRIAGAIAGLPFTRSATYYEFPEVDSIKETENPDAAVDAGEFILINDGEKIKVGRGVNSFTTPTVQKGEDYKSIRIVEVMDMIKDDVRETFDGSYVGKVNNTYDNQVLFITSVNAYFDGLADQEILDPLNENRSAVNVRAQRLAWEGIGTDTTEWSDQQVKEKSFKRNVFLAGNVKIVDAMEDLAFSISI